MQGHHIKHYLKV